MQKPPISAIGMQRQSLERHGGISNGEQIPEQSAAITSFFIENVANMASKKTTKGMSLT
ncbi:hypothetical protein MtrunA17_Chr6g0456961 [Medicago truncatula]|uniref:Uncharacterized protein n=1 Tax=Medicago truncatula TaxID=3880 RepID=A0A396HCM0_MEDTR|nr:hypothetical protein MtrunA17_Chr6g0456961 [Medicago truncatula]